MTIEKFEALSGTVDPGLDVLNCRLTGPVENAIDELLHDYNLDERYLPVLGNYRDGNLVRQKKLARLYEHLGAANLVAFDNYARGANDRYVTW
jgi:hypothetical protein